MNKSTIELPLIAVIDFGSMRVAALALVAAGFLVFSDPPLPAFPVEPQSQERPLELRTIPGSDRIVRRDRNQWEPRDPLAERKLDRPTAARSARSVTPPTAGIETDAVTGTLGRHEEGVLRRTGTAEVRDGDRASGAGDSPARRGGDVARLGRGDAALNRALNGGLNGEHATGGVGALCTGSWKGEPVTLFKGDAEAVRKKSIQTVRRMASIGSTIDARLVDRTNLTSLAKIAAAFPGGLGYVRQCLALHDCIARDLLWSAGRHCTPTIIELEMDLFQAQCYAGIRCRETGEIKPEFQWSTALRTAGRGGRGDRGGVA